jgi:hypothetical protein
MTRFGQSNYGASQDLHFCRKRSMELARERDKWRVIATMFMSANDEQDHNLQNRAVEAYLEANNT